MYADTRRQAILDQLRDAAGPISAAALAAKFSVSRQIIVGDIALLRAAGAEISATPRGYVILPAPPGLVRQVACRHTAAQTREELDAMVDCGCTVIDVVVEHPVYGQLTAPLQIASRYDVEQYLLRMENLGGQPLSMLTDGIHLHTLSCPGEEAFSQLLARLRELGMLVD